MRQLLTIGLLVALLLQASLVAKGITTRITVTDLAESRSVDLVDPVVVGRFDVWSGAGTFSGPPDRQTEGADGFIIEWPGGSIASPPNGLPKYEVRFYVRYPNTTVEQLAYVVLYANDNPSRGGFVYLPGRSDEHYGLNVQAIHRGAGYEGHWFHANRAWQEVIGPLLWAR